MKTILAWILIVAGLTACASLRQESPITAASKLDSAAVQASLPTVLDTAEVVVTMIGDSVLSRRVILRPRSTTAIVASADTFSVTEKENGKVVTERTEIRNSAATPAAADERLKTREIDKRAEVSTAKARNRYVGCYLPGGCGGYSYGYYGATYGTYGGYSYPTYPYPQYRYPGPNYLSPKKRGAYFAPYNPPPPE